MNDYEKMKELFTQMKIDFESGLVIGGYKFISIRTSKELQDIYGVKDIIQFNFNEDGNYISLEFDVLGLVSKLLW